MISSKVITGKLITNKMIYSKDFTELRINILNVLSKNPYFKPRQEICDILEEAWTTVFDNLYKLYKNWGLVRRKTGKKQGRGRPKVFWALTLL
ncbi:unnamed protein product, partial [marine sediment metagenome]